MRIFTKMGRELETLVENRCGALRAHRYQQLVGLPKIAKEQINIGSRQGCIAIAVEPQTNGSLRIIVQGWTESEWFVSQCRLKGFYKFPGESMTPLSKDDEYDFS